MIGWLIALAILVGLAVLPLGVMVKYNAEGLLVRVKIGFLGFTVIPSKKKAQKPKKEKKKKQKKTSAVAEKHKGGSVRRIMPVARLVLEFLSDFRHKLRLKRLELKVIMAGGDPADLAINYGRAWAGIGNLIPLLEQVFVIKKRKVEVECDFVAAETTAIARLDISITLGRLLSLGLRYGLRGVQLLMTIKNSNKGGASK